MIERTPEDKLLSAISIVQSHILANDSTLNAEAVWGPTFAMKNPALELAVDLMIEVLDVVPEGPTKPEAKLAR